MPSVKREAWTRRLKALGLLFRRQSVATAEIARFIKKDRRTALKDLGHLAEHGVPLHKIGTGTDQRWRLPEDWRGVGLDIGLDERLAMLFGRDLVHGVLDETDMGDGMAHLVHHLESLDHGQLSEPELTRRFYCRHEPAKSYASFRDEIRTIIAAILGCHRLRFTYTSPGRQPKRIEAARPVTLLMYKRGLYVIIFPARETEPRFYAIERMSAVEAEAVTFDYPSAGEYHPERIFAERFGITTGAHPVERVRLRFIPQVKAFVVGRRWMPEQDIVELSDGAVELSFLAEGRELVAFVLSFGAAVEVLQPEWLRQEVQQRLAAALQQYRP